MTLLFVSHGAQLYHLPRYGDCNLRGSLGLDAEPYVGSDRCNLLLSAVKFFSETCQHPNQRGHCGLCQVGFKQSLLPKDRRQQQHFPVDYADACKLRRS